MTERPRHIVLDSSVLAPYFLAKSTDSTVVVDRIKMIVDAVLNFGWPDFRLYVPGICFAETQAIFDKYRFCDWHGPVRGDKKKRATKQEYERARNALTGLVQVRRIERLDHEPDHIVATALVSPVNAKYQLRRKRKKKTGKAAKIPSPMGAADCMVVACCVSLGWRVGIQNVVLLSDDRRLTDCVNKLRRLDTARAEELGLIEVAERFGKAWGPWIYPRVLNLRTSSESDLATTFFAWPLPLRRWIAAPDESHLSPNEVATLKTIYRECKANTRKGADSLPYSQELDKIRVELVNRTGKYMDNEIVYRLLSKWRKAGNLN